MCYFGERKFDMNVGKLLNRRAPLILSKPTLLFTYGKKITKTITTQEKENRNPKTVRDIANYENFNLLNELWYR